MCITVHLLGDNLNCCASDQTQITFRQCCRASASIMDVTVEYSLELNRNETVRFCFTSIFVLSHNNCVGGLALADARVWMQSLLLVHDFIVLHARCEGGLQNSPVLQYLPLVGDELMSSDRPFVRFARRIMYFDGLRQTF